MYFMTIAILGVMAYQQYLIMDDVAWLKGYVKRGLAESTAAEYVKGDVNGLYYGGADYYCVFLEGRGADEWASTEAHEQCHALVKREHNHFCNASKT